MARFSTAAMLLALSSATSTNAINGGFQSGPSAGAFYSGGMTYNGKLNRAFLTGSHYNTGITPHDTTKNDMMQGTGLDTASSCYLGKIDFDEAVSGNEFHSLSDWVSYGNPGHLETCTSVAATKSSDVYVVGSVAEGGLFSDGYPMQGLLSIMSQETLGFIDATLIKSAEDPQTHMIYPLDVIHDFERKIIYIAALTSTDGKVNTITGNKDMPNWQNEHLLGSAFDVTVIKILVPEGKKPEAKWVQHFPLDAESDGSRPPVFVAGMALQKDSKGIQHLLISGSTRGSGEAFGKSAPNSVDEDGFVMQLKLSDGTFIQHDRHKGKVFDFQGNLREGTSSDDFIRGMCNYRGRGHESDQHAKDHFYIVGGTKGDMTTDEQGQQDDLDNAGFQFDADVEKKYADSWNRERSMMPFLRQVRISDLKPVWTTQWAAMPKAGSTALPTHAYAMDCYVDNEEQAVYVVGSVMKDAMMTQGNIEMMNQGGDDIWVAKVDEVTGNVFWLTQLGSMDDEKLARHGSIVVNKEGNVLIYGDTNGSMYRPRLSGEDKNTSDMFIMTIDGKTGAVKDDYYMGGTSSASVAQTINGVPPVASMPPNSEPPKVMTLKDKDTTTRSGKKSKMGAAFGAIFAVALVLVGLFFFMSRRMTRQKAEAQKSSIFACLQRFDVEDIDLRRSPPGGWHGTYMNKLAYGHNNAEETVAVDSPTAEAAPLTHSSVASDALFMDADATTAKTSYRDSDNRFSIDAEDDVDVRLNGGVI